MLVLAREKNQEIIIELPDGSTISVMQVDVRGGKSRLGISAASNVGIYRKEVWDAIQRDRQELQNVLDKNNKSE